MTRRLKQIRSFLPVWEGVSSVFGCAYAGAAFPPCMGGCIDAEIAENIEE